MGPRQPNGTTPDSQPQDAKSQDLTSMADLLATAKVAFQAIIEEHRMPDSDVIKLLVSQVKSHSPRGQCTLRGQGGTPLLRTASATYVHRHCL